MANVSHELRTPITSIKGFIETLVDGAMEDKKNAHRFLQIMLRQVNRLDARNPYLPCSKAACFFLLYLL